MSVSDELISQFVKATYDNKDSDKDTTVYGTVVEDGSQLYVRLDGSDVLTPITTTTEIQPGERVVVTIRNHTATVMGNLDNPAFGTKTAGALSSTIEQTAVAIRLEVADGDAQLKSLIEQTADSIRSEVSNGDINVKSIIEQTADAIRQEVSAENEKLESTIIQTASEIRQEVSDGDEGLKSLIEQTASSIRSEITDGDEGLKSLIEQTVSEINQTISNNQNEFTTFKQTVEGWEFVDENGSIIIEDGAIKWSYLANDAQTKVTDAQSAANTAQSTADNATTAANNAQSTADNASSAAANAQSTANGALSIASSANTNASYALDSLELLANGQYQGGTFISGTSIYSPELVGDSIKLTNGSSYQVGEISLVASNTYAFDITSNLSLRLQCTAGFNAFLGNGWADGSGKSAGVLADGDGALLLFGRLGTSARNYGYSLPTSGYEGQIYFLLE